MLTHNCLQSLKTDYAHLRIPRFAYRMSWLSFCAVFSPRQVQPHSLKKALKTLKATIEKGTRS
jgi:hypothetical protein